MRFTAFADDGEHDIEVRPTEGGYLVTIDGTTKTVDTARVDASVYSLIVEGRSYDVSVRRIDRDTVAVKYGGYRREIKIVDPLSAAASAGGGLTGPSQIKAVMPGRVVAVLVEEGQTVRAGQGVLVLEAMKMENEVTAPQDGVVKAMAVAPDQSVEAGATLAIIEPQ
jgi:biotin carboxyl carrier protein